jgi:hypothetical protein
MSTVKKNPEARSQKSESHPHPKKRWTTEHTESTEKQQNFIFYLIPSSHTKIKRNNKSHE